MSEVVRVLSAMRFRGSSEAQLQEAAAATLAAAGITASREVDIPGCGRIDFLVGDVGVELKVDGSLSALTRQVHRYCQSDRVAAMVVVTTRMQHARMPETLRGKEVAVVHVGGYL